MTKKKKYVTLISLYLGDRLSIAGNTLIREMELSLMDAFNSDVGKQTTDRNEVNMKS
jgi:hypothetical protein